MRKTILRFLQGPGALAWRWFTGMPLDGVPRTDGAWFTESRNAPDPDSAPRPPEPLRAEVRSDVRRLREELSDLRVRRALGRELRETERRVLAERDIGES